MIHFELSNLIFAGIIAISSACGGGGYSSYVSGSPQSYNQLLVNDIDTDTIYFTLTIQDGYVPLPNADDCEDLYQDVLSMIFSNLLLIDSDNVMATCLRYPEPTNEASKIVVTLSFDYVTEVTNAVSYILGKDKSETKAMIKFSDIIGHYMKSMLHNPTIKVSIDNIDTRNEDLLYGMVVLEAGTDYSASGVVYLTENTQNHMMTIDYNISGLTSGYHGFHVHEFGDLRGGCSSTGSHYNPFGYDHSASGSVFRHIGDLGNIEADSNGDAIGTMYDQLTSLVGSYNIAGRGMVVHATTDDLGLGGDDGSLATGNAGGRMCCGYIGIVDA